MFYEKGYYMIFFLLPGYLNALTTNLLSTLTDFGSPFLDNRGKRLQRVINGRSSLLLEVEFSSAVLEWMCKVHDTDTYGSDGL